MACCSSACCAWLSAKPLLTAASTNASFVSRLVVWAFTAASTTASFSSMVPLNEATASRTCSIAAWLSANPCCSDASISANLSESDLFALLMAAMISLKSVPIVISISGCRFSHDENASGARSRIASALLRQMRLSFVFFISFIFYFISWKQRPTVAKAWPFGESSCLPARTKR